MITNTEIHFLPVLEGHTRALSRDTKAFETRWPGLLLQAAFSDAVKPQGYISWPVWPMMGINKPAWGAKLILTADLAYLVSCAKSESHTDSTAYFCLWLNVYFSPPTALHLPLHPPARSLPIDSI